MKILVTRAMLTTAIRFGEAREHYAGQTELFLSGGEITFICSRFGSGANARSWLL